MMYASTVIENPIWKVSPWKALMAAHPLGECPVGEDGSDGAVDHLGRVFQGAGGDVHTGLYVADRWLARPALMNAKAFFSRQTDLCWAMRTLSQ